jgi:hypothetical protein
LIQLLLEAKADIGKKFRLFFGVSEDKKKLFCYELTFSSHANLFFPSSKSKKQMCERFLSPSLEGVEILCYFIYMHAMQWNDRISEEKLISLALFPSPYFS